MTFHKSQLSERGEEEKKERKEGERASQTKGMFQWERMVQPKALKVVPSGWSVKLRSQRGEVERKHRPGNEGSCGPGKSH